MFGADVDLQSSPSCLGWILNGSTIESMAGCLILHLCFVLLVQCIVTHNIDRLIEGHVMQSVARVSLDIVEAKNENTKRQIGRTSRALYE